jgi:hypothetical protein
VSDNQTTVLVDGETLVITVEPARKVGPFIYWPSRVWSTLTRDSSWWLTVESDTYPFLRVREKFSTPEQATSRATDLAERLENGGATLRRRFAWRRVWGSSERWFRSGDDP